MISIKQHDALLAVCDNELLGKTFEDGELVLEVSKRFYQGAQISEEELPEHLKSATNINLVGKRAVRIAVKTGMIDNKSIIKISGVPHAQIYSL
ncbi:DUF424 family protein [archaeon]|nr:DUF424 family protein [archaeon]